MKEDDKGIEDNEPGTSRGPAPAITPSTTEVEEVTNTGNEGTDHSGGASRVQRIRASGNSKKNNEDDDLKYDARHVITVVLPVSFCMATVIFTMNTIGYYSQTTIYLPYTPFIAKTDNIFEILWKSVVNGVIFIIGVACLTFGMILLYKYKFYRVMKSWLLLSTLVLLFLFSAIYLHKVFMTWNVPVDYFTMFFILWNFSVMGIICIHWIGPLRIQQIYLVIISALMALTFIKYLPDWTVWAVLFLIAIWDLYAVLSSTGPLRMLIEIAQSRDESLFPSLVYSSGVVYPYINSGVVMTYGSIDNGEQGASSGTENNESSKDGLLSAESEVPPSGSCSATSGLLTSSGMSPSSKAVHRYAPHRHVKVTIKSEGETDGAVIEDNSASVSSHIRGASNSSVNSDIEVTTEQNARGAKVSRRQRVRPTSSRTHREDSDESDSGGVKLGLGDFIFYSVLVGKASSYGDWNTTVACYIGILIGLCFTLLLLAIFRKALPALPISIAFGLTFYMSTRAVISPFCNQLVVRQIML